ncbi:hypothetical protein ABL78_6248 [Leptomonas seymouri]|uniref:Selenoprotein F/M domain-containing protein n=1 Tax=Leptomonas seymouri TaxID=5684 RepID=A0A0N1I2C9_LEPSE|nr:hypothetical protein ABL78_6248 [Leptomonas seymouri]|eukprot:KPI84702.1 hypothetical protein ABL78_6248 [Leptomonas seymouri]
MRRMLLFCFVEALVVLLAVMTTATPVNAARTQAECLELGFDKDMVRCTYCEKLFIVTQSPVLQQECLDCCISSEDDAEAATVKYPAARIELRNLPHSMQPSSTGLVATFRRMLRGRPYFNQVSFIKKNSIFYPQVVLVDDEAKDAVRFSIMGWSLETLDKFLTEKIRVD